MAVLVKLSSDLLLVSSQKGDILGPFGFLLLLDRAEDSPGCPPGTDGVFIGDREKVSLLNGQIGIGLNDFVHGIEHVFVPLSLLCDFGHIKVLFPGVCSHQIF